MGVVMYISFVFEAVSGTSTGNVSALPYGAWRYATLRAAASALLTLRSAKERGAAPNLSEPPACTSARASAEATAWSSEDVAKQTLIMPVSP